MHTTPLPEHFKQKVFWRDILILLFIWSTSFLLKDKITFLKINFSQLIQLTALIGTFELASFIFFHLAGPRKGILLLGFMGGFISSTAVFLNLQDKEKYGNNSSQVLMCSLWLAVSSMLIECLFITYTLTYTFKEFLALSWPVVVQILFIIPFIIYFNHRSDNIKNANIESITKEMDRPIAWRKVIQFSLLIIILIFGIRFLSETFNVSRKLSCFFASLFEAHGALASVMLGNSGASVVDQVELVFIILTGNVVSKSTLIFKSQFTFSKTVIVLPLILSMILSFILYLFFNN